MSNSRTPNDMVAIIIFCKMMLAFEVDRISIDQWSSGCIRATVGWPDQGQPYYDPEEEQQKVVWKYGQTSSDVSVAIEYLIVSGLLRSDRIQTNEQELTARLSIEANWSQDRTARAIAALLAIRIEMIDEDAPGDAFYVHF